MKTLAFIRDNGACGYYRVSLPLKTCKYVGGEAVNFIEKGDSADRIMQLLDADIAVFPRPSETPMLQAIKDLKNAGTKIVVDHDDNMFKISPLSPHYEENGTEEVTIALPDGTDVKLWEDGKNIDLKKNRQKLDNFKKALEIADMVTVTTDILASVYREYNKNVVVLPNCVKPELWQSLDLNRDDTVRLFWAGGSSHYEDWTILSDVLPEIMSRYKNVKLVILGQMFKGTVKNLPQDRIEHHPWVPTPAYPYKVSILDPHIGIIPLRDTEFNRCKSAIKWTELSAMGVPSVVSNVSPYKEIARENNGVFVDNQVDSWVKGISLLIEDRILRAKIGANAQAYALAQFDINRRYGDWVDAYRSLL